MVDVFLISEKTLKTKSYINDNVDSCYILPAIQTAQDLGLQPLIGTCLYNELKQQVASGDIKPSYLILLNDYITPYLTFKVMADIQLPLAYKQRNSGVVQTSTEHVQNTTFSDAQSMATYYNDKATFYGSRLTDYLCHHSSEYPEYKSCGCDGMKPDKDAWNMGIFLG